MVAKIEITNLGDVIRRYQDGASITKLSNELGFSRDAITRALRVAGVELRGLAEAAKLNRHQVDAAGMKTCGRCKVLKHVSDFFKSCINASGFSSWCRQCTKDSKQEKYVKGECVSCGKAKEESRQSLTLCLNCQKDKTNGVMKVKERYRINGLCMSCGTNPQLLALQNKRNAVCEDCYIKQTATATMKQYNLWRLLKEKLVEQNYRCPYTGNLLVLGVNASIDHIYPQSRFPELISNPDNFEWVDIKVNHIKRNMTRDEFVTMLRNIVNHLSS
jgi:hypothetical protein